MLASLNGWCEHRFLAPQFLRDMDDAGTYTASPRRHREGESSDPGTVFLRTRSAGRSGLQSLTWEGYHGGALAARQHMDALLKGALIGLSVAAPPGPNALMCMSRTLAGGRSAGLRAGLGAASAHAVYAGVAVFGVEQAAKVLVRGATPVRLVGGIILLVVGLRLGLSQSRRGTPANASAYPLTFAIGLVNPLTLLYFTAAVALGTIPAGAGSSVVAGVFIGSALWWTALTQVVATLGHHLDNRRLAWANRLVAFGIAAMGALAVGTAL